MEASIVVFTLRKDMKPVEKVKFCQAFYGRDISTWKGRYHYHVPGVLDEIPHRKLSKGVLIIRTSDLVRIRESLKEKTEELYIRSITPESEDIDALTEEKHSENKE